MDDILSPFTQFLQSTWSNPATLTFTCFTFFSLVLWVLRGQSVSRNRKNRNDVVHFRNLPSPPEYPIVGHVTQLGRVPHLVMTKWAKKYGALYRLKLGFKDALIVTGLDVIKQASASKSGIAFAGRPDFETSKLICKGLSLAFSNYSPEWVKQRAATRAALQLYTTGKDSSKRYNMENTAAKHADALLEQLIDVAQTQNGLINPRDYILCHVSNAICSVCFGKDFDICDPKLQQLLKINKSFDAAMGAAQPVNFWPILKHIPIISEAYKNLEIYMGHYWNLVSSMLDSHWATYDPENMRDITDCLYRESEKIRNNNNKIVVSDLKQNGTTRKTENSGNIKTENELDGNLCHQNGYSIKNQNKSILPLNLEDDEMKQLEVKKRIVFAAGDIFGAGYDTTFSTVYWSILYLAALPDTQAKIRDEINRAVAPDENISFRNHGSKCMYTRAWIYELLRHASISPLLLPRCTTEATVLNNCYIPAGVTVYFNAWQTYKDPEIWEDPTEFKPERFLKEEDGVISLNASVVSKLLSWGIGKRRCAGQDLSKHLLFIFISTIVRKCQITQSQPGIEPVLLWPYSYGLILKSEPFKVHIKRCENA